MTLEAIYYISQIVAVLAILASLIFVGLQVRQSNRAAEQANTLAKANMTQAAWAVGITMQHEIFSTGEGADIMHRAMFGTAPLTEAEKMRFNVNMSTLLNSIESGDLFWRQGLFDDPTYQRLLHGMAVYFQSPQVRKWWAHVRQVNFIPPFSDVIDEISQKAEAAQIQAQADTKSELGEDDT